MKILQIFKISYWMHDQLYGYTGYFLGKICYVCILKPKIIRKQTHLFSDATWLTFPYFST